MSAYRRMFERKQKVQVWQSYFKDETMSSITKEKQSLHIHQLLVIDKIQSKEWKVNVTKANHQTSQNFIIHVFFCKDKEDGVKDNFYEAHYAELKRFQSMLLS